MVSVSDPRVIGFLGSTLIYYVLITVRASTATDRRSAERLARGDKPARGDYFWVVFLVLASQASRRSSIHRSLYPSRVRRGDNQFSSIKRVRSKSRAFSHSASAVANLPCSYLPLRVHQDSSTFPKSVWERLFQHLRSGGHPSYYSGYEGPHF
jgi:hypothetical protein